jgi:hypothetical protein
MTEVSIDAAAAAGCCAQEGAAMGPMHKVRATGHACRLERWRVDRLLMELRRMGLLEAGEGVGVGVGAEGQMRALGR